MNKEEEEDNLSSELQSVSELITYSRFWGLSTSTEVIRDAIKIAKSDPDKSVKEICQKALNKWDV